MLHASCSSFCYFLSFRGQHGLGEAQGDGRGAEQPQHNTQRTLGASSRGGNHLQRESLDIFVSHGWCLWGISHWAAAAAWLWDARLQHSGHLCRWDGLCLSQALLCGNSAQLLLLIPAALLFYFSNTENRERRKTHGTKEHQPFPSLREGFHIPLAP